MVGENSEVIEAKYSVGQVVWFYTLACSGDDCLVKYPCISRGRITSVYAAGSTPAYDRREIEYGMQEAGEWMVVEESNIYPDSVNDVLKRLEGNWESDWAVL